MSSLSGKINNPFCLTSFILLILVTARCSDNQKRSTHPQNTTAKASTDTPTFDELMAASLNGDLNKVKAIANKGMDINRTDPAQRTPLMLAAYNGHTNVVKFLINEGAEVNISDKQGRTALMFASTGNFSTTVQILLKHEAAVNATDKEEHWSPLMFAAAEGQIEVVELLLEFDADPSLKDTDGETALDFAKQNNHHKVVALLKNA